MVANAMAMRALEYINIQRFLQTSIPSLISGVRLVKKLRKMEYRQVNALKDWRVF